MPMIEIDGSLGEGGGQVLRSSLSLSMVTGKPVRLTNIRSRRTKPGLMRQHLTCVKAAATVAAAEVDGAEPGSVELKFRPGQTTGGEYQFAVGSAGSTVLVAQTLLPALCLAWAPSDVVVEGGTHAAWAPSFDFLLHSFRPLVQSMGWNFDLELVRFGFYPAGGGQIRVRVQPGVLTRGLSILDRGGTAQNQLTATVAGLSASVARRECDTARRKLEWPEEACHVESDVDSGGPGNVVTAMLRFPNLTETLFEPGRTGVRAEKVARDLVRSVKRYLNSGVPVGEYLADQLLMPMGIAATHGFASEFVTGPLSSHAQTHIQILKRFLDVRIEVEEEAAEIRRVRVIRGNVGNNE